MSETKGNRCDYCDHESESCKSTFNSFVCTRPKGHDGEHKACGFEHPIVAWVDKQVTYDKENENSMTGTLDEINELKRRLEYWEKRATEQTETANYYRAELTKAHALLGRVIHQQSERWDSVNLTEHFPTDNLNRKRRVGNPTGE